MRVGVARENGASQSLLAVAVHGVDQFLEFGRLDWTCRWRGTVRREGRVFSVRAQQERPTTDGRWRGVARHGFPLHSHWLVSRPVHSARRAPANSKRSLHPWRKSLCGWSPIDGACVALALHYKFVTPASVVITSLSRVGSNTPTR